MKISSIQNNTVENNTNSSSNAKKVAREFESLFTSMMMKSMRKTVLDGGLIPKSIGEKIYTDMLDLEYAKIISKNASFGLAEQILKQIESGGEQSNILNTLKNLKNQPWMIDNRFIPEKYGDFMDSRYLATRVEHWNPYIDEASTMFDIDKDLISAVIAQESAGNPYAVSRAGAKGLMQLMDSTARTLGVQHIFNPRENIIGGTKYLEQLLKQFNGDETLALASYNAGPNAVNKYGGVPPYRETRDYIKRVLAIREEFKKGSEPENMDNINNGD